MAKKTIQIKNRYDKGKHPNSRNGFRKGHFVSIETRKKIREKRKGYLHSDEIKRKISQTLKKKNLRKTQEQKDKLSRERMFGGVKNWKGENVGYSGLHNWVRKWKGKPTKCSMCGTKSNVEWANINHKYKRDLNDFISLCIKHHQRYDKIHNFKQIGRKKKDAKNSN